jgi:hypothetical protein
VAIDDAGHRAVRHDRIRDFRHPPVAGAHVDACEVGDHRVGPVLQQIAGVLRRADSDHQRNPAVAGRGDPVRFGPYHHRPLRPCAEPLGRLAHIRRVKLNGTDNGRFNACVMQLMHQIGG